MSTIDIKLYPGNKKKITFETKDKYNTEDIIFNIECEQIDEELISITSSNIDNIQNLYPRNYLVALNIDSFTDINNIYNSLLPTILENLNNKNFTLTTYQTWFSHIGLLNLIEYLRSSFSSINLNLNLEEYFGDNLTLPIRCVLDFKSDNSCFITVYFQHAGMEL